MLGASAAGLAHSSMGCRLMTHWPLPRAASAVGVAVGVDTAVITGAAVVGATLGPTEGVEEPAGAAGGEAGAALFPPPTPTVGVVRGLPAVAPRTGVTPRGGTAGTNVGVAPEVGPTGKGCWAKSGPGVRRARTRQMSRYPMAIGRCLYSRHGSGPRADFSQPARARSTSARDRGHD